MDGSPPAPGLNISSIDEHQFKNPEEVEKLIEHLNEVRKNMKHGVNGHDCEEEKGQGNKVEDSIGSIYDDEDALVDKFDQIETLDLDSIPDFPEGSWLAVYTPPANNEERMAAVSSMNCFEPTYFDTGLVNVRYQLVNTVKAAINESRFAELKTGPSPYIQTSSGSSQIVPKRSASATSAGLSPAVGSQTTCTPLRRNLSYVIRRDSASQQTPSNVNHYENSNGESPVLEVYCSGHNINASLNGSDANSTVPIKSHACMGRTSLPIIGRPGSLNTTMAGEYSPPKCVNYSGPNSPDLNSTFTQQPPTQDDMSTSSNSNNSVYNISMEEVHTMARIQEQSLARKSTSTPLTITRRDTHILGMTENGQDYPVSTKQWPGGAYVLDDTSNPPSNSSSGVSSPRENQSYESIQLADPIVRRSMPNLALVKEIYSSPRKQSITLGIHAAASSSNTQLKKQPHYISDSKLARPQTRALPKPTVYPPHFPRGLFAPHSQSATDNSPSNRPYSSNYGATFTRGKTFEKLPDNTGVDRRPYTSNAVPTFEERVRSNSRRQSGAGGRSVPHNNSGTFTREKSSSRSTVVDQPDPAQPDLAQPQPDTSDHDVPNRLRLHSTPGSHNLLAYNRPSQLPHSRLRSRIPGPGKFSVAPQNRSTNYKD